MKIHILTPVWGESFVDMFLQCTLPCLASEGNLPALARDHEVTFRIFTTPGEARRMACTPLVRHLSTFMEVAFTDLDALEVLEAATVFERMEDASYRKSAGCVLEGLRYAWEEQAGLLFIAPDNVYSDGALARVAEAIDSGKRGLLLGSMAVCEDTFMPALATAAPLDPAGARIIAPRALAHLGLMHRHSWMQGAFLESSSFHIHSTLYWAGDQGGYLARSWHLQPLFLHPQRRADQFFISQDNDLVGQLVEDVRDLEIIVDSDEITLIDIHPKNSNRFFKKVDDPFSPLRFALAAEQVYVSAFNFQHVRHALIFHDVDLTPDWTDLERASDQMVDEIQAWMSFLEPGSWSHPRNLDQKRQQEALSMLDHFRQVVGRASGEAGAPVGFLASLCYPSARMRVKPGRPGQRRYGP